MRAYTDIFTNKIFPTKDYTYHSLKDIIRDKDLLLLNGDKDSSIFVMNRTDYNTIMLKMINYGIKNQICGEVTGNTGKDLKHFQEFLYRNIKDYENYDDMTPVSNQPAKLYGTAKTHKCDNLEDITPQNLNIVQL